MRFWQNRGLINGRFEVQTKGAWTITITPLATANVLNVPGTFEGSGDHVFTLIGEMPDIAKISGNAGGYFFAVMSYRSSRDLLVNTTAPYDGTVLVDGDTLFIEVQADDAWSFAVTSR